MHLKSKPHPKQTMSYSFAPGSYEFDFKHILVIDKCILLNLQHVQMPVVWS